jgi:putative FmdB family regulatory protein
MPYYNYQCTECKEIFETQLHIADYKLPELLPCQSCWSEGTVKLYIDAAPAIGDSVKLGITRPPDAFLHGVLGRMQNSIPDGGLLRDSAGKIQVGQDGKPKKKYVNFNNARYQPGRLV